MDRVALVNAAMGKTAADTLFTNAKLVNVFTGVIETESIAVKDGIIIGYGHHEAKRTVDLDGKYLAPGFIDGHVHIESSMMTPREFARVIIPHGTTTVIADPHEIANVSGVSGIE